MGQAYDKDGHILGEFYGQTKREVFDALTLKHPDAAEIRIRTMEAQHVAAVEPATPQGASAEMPRYRCHKEVWALKIKEVGFHGDSENGTTGGRITPEDEGYAPFEVDGDYMNKHKPQVGGYYVVYKDGYKSFSPAEAFEDGYTRI